jgi:hypothetical protein
MLDDLDKLEADTDNTDTPLQQKEANLQAAMNLIHATDRFLLNISMEAKDCHLRFKL